MLVKLGLLALAGGFVAVLVPGMRGPDEAPVTQVFELEDLAPGQAQRLLWRGKPLWVLRRDAGQIEALTRARDGLADADSARSSQPAWARNAWRSRQGSWLVVIGVGTDLGCPVEFLPASGESFRGASWPGGFRETCGSSRYDLAGRAFSGQAGERNLPVPDYRLDGLRLTVHQ